MTFRPGLQYCLGILLAAAVALPGCNPFRRGERVASCNRPQLYAQAENLPPLRIPEGLDAPNTRGALRVPDLKEPEVARKPGDPCLDEPPRFSATARLEPAPKGRRGRNEAPPATPAAAPEAQRSGPPSGQAPPARR